MTGLCAIWRHPIKGLGAEALTQVALSAGATLPGDRIWAVAHDRARIERAEDGWAPCSNFLRGASAPKLMAVTAQFDAETRRVTLQHPERPTQSFAPDQPEDAAALLAWAAPLIPEGRAQPAHILAATARGLTDSASRTVSIASRASLRAIERAAGTALDPRRFRINLWLDGKLPAWGEMDWIDREFSIGPVRFRGVKPVERCRAIDANPENGTRDLDLLPLMAAQFGHRNLGLKAEIISGGLLAIDDPLKDPIPS